MTELAEEEAGVAAAATDSEVVVELVTVFAPGGALETLPGMVCVWPLASMEIVRGTVTAGGAETVGCGVEGCPPPNKPPKTPEFCPLDDTCCDCWESEFWLPSPLLPPVKASIKPLLASCTSGAS